MVCGAISEYNADQDKLKGIVFTLMCACKYYYVCKVKINDIMLFSLLTDLLIALSSTTNFPVAIQTPLNLLLLLLLFFLRCLVKCIGQAAEAPLNQSGHQNSTHSYMK